MAAKRLGEAGRQRVMHAAGNVEVDDAREAAILGGLVRSFIDTGGLNIALVQHYAPQVIEWFDVTRRQINTLPVNGDSALAPYPSRARPTRDEIALVLAKFIRFYDPPATIPTAA